MGNTFLLFLKLSQKQLFFTVFVCVCLVYFLIKCSLFFAVFETESKTTVFHCICRPPHCFSHVHRSAPSPSTPSQTATPSQPSADVSHGPWCSRVRQRCVCGIQHSPANLCASSLSRTAHARASTTYLPVVPTVFSTASTWQGQLAGYSSSCCGAPEARERSAYICRAAGQEEGAAGTLPAAWCGCSPACCCDAVTAATTASAEPRQRSSSGRPVL